MRVTILGCGPSYGVPSLSAGFGKCSSQNPKNIRYRSSILIEEQGQNILVDAPPEIRLELLRSKIKKIDALLCTHAHFDHIAGFEDIRKWKAKEKKILDIYGRKDTLKELKDRNSFIFMGHKDKEWVKLHYIKMYHPFKIENVSIIPIKQYHGNINSVGYRVGKFAYSTDVKSMDKKGWELLKGIDTWVLGCVTDQMNNKHICLDEALKWIQRIKPKHTFLTHLGAELDYDTLCKKLPKNVKPVYDGMVIKIKS